MNENVTSNCCTCCDCCVHFPNETTPLVQRERSNANFCVVLLLFCTLCLGVAVGTYLLIEDGEWESDQPIPIMTTTALNSQLNATAQDRIIDKIKVVEILGPPCENDVECNEQISRDNNTNARSDLFNFLIDSNATIYEHQGYDNHCLNCDSNSLVIALSSSNATSASSRYQTYKIEEIIDYGVNRTTIAPCSLISTDEKVHRLRKIADEIQYVINRKYKCVKYN